MLALSGSGLGRGIAIGKAFVLPTADPDIPEYRIAEDQLDSEINRFYAAIRDARSQLQEIREHIPKDAPPESTVFMDTHLLMLDDPMISEKPAATIRERGCNAEQALRIHADSLIGVFQKMEDEYLRSKTVDIEQVVTLIQNNLLNIQHKAREKIIGGLEDRIVVTRDLSPADTVLLKHHRMAAFVTDLGGPISHTAILARSLQVPAVVGLHGATRYVKDGDTLVVDGKYGVIIVDPDDDLVDMYRLRIQVLEQRRTLLEKLRSSDPVTRDGERIALLANVELPEDIDATLKLMADGIGLYRTEYLFMNRREPPSEAEQFAAYSRVLKRLQRPVTIRTLDLGADKQVDGGRQGVNTTTNPALGLRAVRLCLHNPGLFKPQLRALLRASAYGRLEIMIPMISSLDEMDQVLAIIEETKGELAREGYPFDRHIRVGGMIEVPAAAVAADLFAHRFDFLSIGTNDLIQYTLAIDRVDDAVNYLYDPLHPSVLRLIKMTIDAGRSAGIPVSMCGEMAGNIKYTRLLLGLGLRIFSMDPTALLEVKKVILDTDLKMAQRITETILRAESLARLHELVEQLDASD
ncbi:MAG: phosphoenolpyruvate--protein phosphotransferase [Gammaproteobacteria bacterium]|nr:phosphoenolpyruvate--protein phosphotransferase [Gammaproteobacteria bacterium]